MSPQTRSGLPAEAPQESETQTAPSLRGLVGLGASAGGLHALEGFFRAVEPGHGLAYVVVQHLSPDFKSLMEDLLARQTRLAIHRVIDGMRLEPDCIYLIPARTMMRVLDRHLQLEERSGPATDLPIDVFFASLARSWGRQAVAIVLSGTGSDGSQGVRAIATSGGLALAQDPATAEFSGMPQAAIDTGLVHEVADPAGLAALARDLLGRSREHTARIAAQRDELAPLERILLLLQDQTGIDFSVYKIATVQRRITRRMGLRQIDSMADYLSLLAGDPEEAARLLSDLLIGVTSFFRDEDVFRLLREQVLPELIARFADVEELRVWVAGCATGEEAYSLAMLLHEAAQQGRLTGRIRIFASDLHKPAIQLASSGIYAMEDIAAIPTELAERYTVPISSRSVRIAQAIRDLVVFAPHNLLLDPPFTRLHLTSCRNLLIYLEQEAQNHALNIFGYALQSGGILQLGSSEGLGTAAEFFDPIDAQCRTYRKVRSGPMPLIGQRRPRARAVGVTSRPPQEANTATVQDHRLLHDYDLILRQTQLCGFLLDDQRRLLHVFGDAGQYLSMPSGRVNDDVTRLLPEELGTAVASLSQRAGLSMEVHSIQGLHLTTDAGQPCLVDLVASPLPGRSGSAAHVLLSLRNRRSAVTLPAEPEAERLEMSLEQAYRQRIDDLELELNATRENLQATIEELETANEELQSANEELQSSNEELQSSNEELHSVNEELYTVNAEYENKNRILSELNRDHSALLDSVDVAIIFLD
ncbi:MAG: chemotaxis protein CheB, partial [Planctomycetota bacterium]